MMQVQCSGCGRVIGRLSRRGDQIEFQMPSHRRTDDAVVIYPVVGLRIQCPNPGCRTVNHLDAPGAQPAAASNPPMENCYAAARALPQLALAAA